MRILSRSTHTSLDTFLTVSLSLRYSVWLANISIAAGGLCYRDGRMRFLITWTSPYLSRGSTTEGIGIYGIEGSKPGAAAMSTYLSNKCIGLNQEGYGALLAEVTFTCSRVSLFHPCGLGVARMTKHHPE